MTSLAVESGGLSGISFSHQMNYLQWFIATSGPPMRRVLLDFLELSLLRSSNISTHVNKVSAPRYNMEVTCTT